MANEVKTEAIFLYGREHAGFSHGEHVKAGSVVARNLLFV